MGCSPDRYGSVPDVRPNTRRTPSDTPDRPPDSPDHPIAVRPSFPLQANPRIRGDNSVDITFATLAAPSCVGLLHLCCALSRLPSALKTHSARASPTGVILALVAKTQPSACVMVGWRLIAVRLSLQTRRRTRGAMGPRDKPEDDTESWASARMTQTFRQAPGILMHHRPLLMCVLF
jgi:hypothetical protein